MQKSRAGRGNKAADEAIKLKIEKMGERVNGWNSRTPESATEVYDGDWTQRAAVAVAGILANDPAEAVYPFTRQDGDGKPLDGSNPNYTLTFPKRLPRSTPSGR